MNDFSKILPTSKISSASQSEAYVDLITDKWIYIWFRWQSLKQFDRLYFTKEQVNSFFINRTRTLIDWRIQTTLKEIRAHYNSLFIEWIDEHISIDSIFNWDKVGTVVHCNNSRWIRKVLWTKIVDWVKYIYLTPILPDLSSPTETAVRLCYKFDDIKDELSTTSRNKKTLDQLAIELFGVSDASFLFIKDMPDVLKKEKVS